MRYFLLGTVVGIVVSFVGELTPMTHKYYR
ncbi:hypothetical protein B0G93_10789 [Bacillus sp. V-88]|nr:hypothetical protein B0G93_10789 [Bacillus sp. V-88]SLK22018.1 hypothetical protein SAMN06295884_10789 [Bacillus sp. V-88]